MNNLKPQELFTEPILQLRQIVMEQIDSHGRPAILGNELNKLVKRGSGRSVVLLSFTSDFLRLLSMCLLADRKLNPPEVQFLFPLLGPASKLYARYRSDYRELGPVNRGNVHEFLGHYNNDSDLFGFRCPLTRWGGIDIVNNVSSVTGDSRLLDFAKAAYGKLGNALRAVSGGGLEIERIIENVEDNFTATSSDGTADFDFELDEDEDWDLADFETG